MLARGACLTPPGPNLQLHDPPQLASLLPSPLLASLPNLPPPYQPPPWSSKSPPLLSSTSPPDTTFPTTPPPTTSHLRVQQPQAMHGFEDRREEGKERVGADQAQALGIAHTNICSTFNAATNRATAETEGTREGSSALGLWG